MKMLFQLSACVCLFVAQLSAVEREVWGSFRIALVGAERSSAVYAAARAGAQDAAVIMEQEHRLAIDLVFKAPQKATPGEQKALLGKLFIEGMDGIMLDPSPGKVLAAEVTFLQKQGIPFVFFNRDLPGVERLAYIGTDQQALGQLAVEALAESLGRLGGSTAILAGEAASPVSQSRLSGAERALQESIEVDAYGVFHCVEALTPCINELTRVTQGDRDNELDAWLFLGPWALGGGNDLPWLPGAMPCVAIGAEPPQLPYLRRGLVDALIAEKYYEWGYQSVVLLIEKLFLKKDPDPKVILTDGEVITKENLADYQLKWTEWYR